MNLVERLEAEVAEWEKCEEAIDSAASLALAALLREAASEIRRLRSSGAGIDE